MFYLKLPALLYSLGSLLLVTAAEERASALLVLGSFGQVGWPTPKRLRH